MDNKASWKRDFRLLKKISKGDEGAFEALYKTTSQKTFFYLLRRLEGKGPVKINIALIREIMS